jgi:hypothetical protein
MAKQADRGAEIACFVMVNFAATCIAREADQGWAREVDHSTGWPDVDGPPELATR